MTLCNQAEFARLMKVSKVSVTNWKNSDWLVISEGKVHVEASIERLKRYRDSTDGRAQKGSKEVNDLPVNLLNGVNLTVNQVNAAVNSGDEPIRPPGWPFPQSLPHPDDGPVDMDDVLPELLPALAWPFGECHSQS